MTSSAATSSTHIEPAIDAVRSATTTGAPVTVYVAPLAGFHSFIATAARICAQRRAALRLAETGLQPHLDERRGSRAAGLGGKQVGELALRRAGGLGGVEDERGDEVRVVDARDRAQAVAHGELDDLGWKAWSTRGARAVGGPLRGGGARAPGGGRRGAPCAPRRWPAGVLRDAPREAAAELAHGLVDERAGPEDDLDRLRRARADRRVRSPRRAAPRRRAGCRQCSPPGRARARGPGRAAACSASRGRGR